MRIVSFNILDGGQNRVDAIAEVLKEHEPDVVCLVEADNAGKVAKIAGRLGMKYIHGLGKSHASAVLSRLPLRESINHSTLLPALTKSFLEVHLRAPDGEDWIIGALHLRARAEEADEDVRMLEIESILKAFAPHRAANRRHILCGDFNANAPSQIIDPEKCKPRTRDAWRQNGGNLPRRVVQRLLDEGYLDTFHTFDPTAADTTASFTTEYPGQRVDYIFTFGLAAEAIRDAGVIQSNLAKKASDHFPVFATIQPKYALRLNCQDADVT